jgi:excisionase family DNA binding protein
MSELLTIQQAAERTPFSVKTLRRAIKAGRLPYSQPTGKTILICPDALSAWLSSGGKATPGKRVVSSTVRPYVARRYSV